jgi:hypothetical protein
MQKSEQALLGKLQDYAGLDKLVAGKLEVYAILNKVATDRTEFVLFYTKSYVCENSLFYVCRCPDLVLEGANHPDPNLEGANHIHFSQFTCEKRI